MGKRIEYEIMREDTDAPCAILYSNSHHPAFDGEAIFRAEVERQDGPTTLVEALLAYRYTPHPRIGHRPGDPVFWIISLPGDREFVLRAYGKRVEKVGGHGGDG